MFYKTAVTAIFALLTTLAAASTVFWDAADRTPFTIWQKGLNNDQQARYEKDALHFVWQPAQERILIASFPRPAEQPLAAFIRGTCQIELELPADSPVNSFSVRFLDAKKRIFQWRAPIAIRKAGNHTVTIPMTPDNFFWTSAKEKPARIHFPLRFQAICAAANRGEARLAVRNIRGEFTVPSPLSLLKFDLDTGNAARVILPGQAPRLRLQWQNPTDAPVTCRASGTLRHPDGDTVEIPAVELTIPAQRQTDLAPALPPLPKQGIWQVTGRVVSPDGKSTATVTRSLACMTPAGPDRQKSPDDFIFGVCVPDWHRPAEFDREAEVAALCGATALRLNFRWLHLEKSKGNFDWRNLEKIRAAYALHHIELMPIVSNPPSWARKDPKNHRSLPDYAQWRDYIHLLFTRYGKTIRFWEVWNEPDLYSFALFPAPEYVELMKIVREEQRKTAPDAKILSGGFATLRPHRGSKPGFEAYALAHGRDFFDIHAQHEHGAFKTYYETVETRLLPLRRKIGLTQPWFANETACSAFGIGETAQAETLFKKFLYTWSTGAVGYNWYNLRNNGSLPNDPEHHYGLVTYEYYPKANFVTYNMLATLFRGGKFVQRPPTAPGIWILDFAVRDGRAAAIWNEDPLTAADDPAVFETDAVRAEAVDLAGNRRPLPLSGGRLIHRIGSTPEVLHFINAKKLRHCGSLVRSEVRSFVRRGTPVELRLQWFNPLPHELSIQCRLRPSAGIRGAPDAQTLTLKPGERRETTVQVQADQTQDAAWIQQELQWGGGSETLRIPLKLARVISLRRNGNDWDFVLNRYDQVKSLFGADPGNQDKLWRGPADLSAKIRLSRNDRSLFVEIDATDDKHVQPHHGEDVYKGDNVQLALSIPGQNGMWVIGATCHTDGKPELYVWSAPAGFTGKTEIPGGRLTATRQGTRTGYRIEMPLASLGLTPERLSQGIRFNLLLNDNDGDGRKGWIQIADGIAANRNDYQYPVLCFE